MLISGTGRGSRPASTTASFTETSTRSITESRPVTEEYWSYWSPESHLAWILANSSGKVNRHQIFKKCSTCTTNYNYSLYLQHATPYHSPSCPSCWRSCPSCCSATSFPASRRSSSRPMIYFNIFKWVKGINGATTHCHSEAQSPPMQATDRLFKETVMSPAPPCL